MPSRSVTVKLAPGEALEGIASEPLAAFGASVLRQIQALTPRLTDSIHFESSRTI